MIRVRLNIKISHPLPLSEDIGVIIVSVINKLTYKLKGFTSDIPQKSPQPPFLKGGQGRFQTVSAPRMLLTMATYFCLSLYFVHGIKKVYFQ